VSKPTFDAGVFLNDTARSLRFLDKRRSGEQLSVIVADDRPSWLDVAKFCQADARLRPGESDFVNNMILLTADGKEPSPRQARWLSNIFERIQQQ